MTDKKRGGRSRLFRNSFDHQSLRAGAAVIVIVQSEVEAETDRDNAKSIYDRTKSLADSKVVAREEVDAAYVAYNAARAFVQANPSSEVPIHLRNAPTRLMKELGYGRAYRYAHDEPEAYAAGERYFPDGMAPQRWYRPVERGLEAKIRAKLEHLRELDAQAQRRRS